MGSVKFWDHAEHSRDAPGCPMKRDCVVSLSSKENELAASWMQMVPVQTE